MSNRAANVAPKSPRVKHHPFLSKRMAQSDFARRVPPVPPISPNSIADGLTWALLVKLEPRLLELYNSTRRVRDDKRKPWFCANRIWYEVFKPVLVDLVGWSRRHWDTDGDQRLWTSRAYDIAYHKIYDPLPACRNCACVGFGEYIGEVLASRAGDQ